MTKSVRQCGYVVALFLVGLVHRSPAQTSAPCSAAGYHEFGFWIGNWDVFETDTQKKVAHARVDSILNGCVLREDYQQFDGHKGQSFNIYDAARNSWHQSWVTNRGESLEIEGKFDGHSIVLTGEDRAASRLVRGTWTPDGEGVREIAVTSTDGGKTWQPWFDLVFKLATKDTASDPEDAKTIENLDARYQAAVKSNDAETMGRLLADDFMLVTGSGKTYSKADLIEEARSGQFHYDRQDDSDQTVRSWGDTAVITAKLTARGTDAGKPFDYQVWFSDTYLKTPNGWKYVFGQSSLRLPPS
jgi:ketosteroid isomerase-like protein